MAAPPVGAAKATPKSSSSAAFTRRTRWRCATSCATCDQSQGKGPVEDRGLRFYDLRHSCASLLIAQGVPLKVIQEILRHSNIRTTSDRYTHLVPQVVGEALAAMDRTLLEAEAT